MSSQSSKSTRTEREDQRKAAAAQARQEQRAKERRRAILGGGAVMVVLAALVVAIVFGVRTNNAKPATNGDQVLPSAVTAADGAATIESAVTKVTNTTGIEGVVAYDTTGYPGKGTSPASALPHTHVSGPVTYSLTPPVGGDHNGVWMNAGVYTEPVPSVRAVHDLEHGAVWITYRPNLSATQVKELQDFVGKQSLIDESGNANRFIVMSPWASNDLPAPIVISSWGYQLPLTDPNDARLQQFVDKFRHSQTYTPEFGSPVDGVPVNIGGRAAIYGGKFANPVS